MFDNIDELFIDDEYTSDTEGYENSYDGEIVEEGFLDPDVMYSDAAIESFTSIDPYDDSSDVEYMYASEALLNSIETDMEVIATEAETAKRSFKEKMNIRSINDKQSRGKAWSKIRQALGNVVARMARFARNHSAKLVSKGGKRRAQFWTNFANSCEKLAAKIKGQTLPKDLELSRKEVKEKQRILEEEKAKDDATILKTSLSMKTQAEKNFGATAPGRQRANIAKHQGTLLDTGSRDYFEEDDDDVSSGASTSSNGGETIAQRNARLNAADERNKQAAQREAQKKKNMNKNAVKGRVNRAKKLIEQNKAKVRVKGNRGVDPNAVDSFIVEDLDEGYSVAVEGLFSKPKTAEALLSKMQKKVGRLKSIGACDDMIRQLNAEASKFNSALSALKKASGDFQKTNDKKALKAAAGPVLKDLNKTCKLLKIKSISSDPKNITQEEIAKLHDFIKGAKQLIVARKKVLSGAATESVLSGYENDFEVANEGYEDDGDMMDFLSGDFEDFDDDDIEIADEALIEDFIDADQDIAIATEGIIDPDAKRAHRIKFGEKKRQIQSIVKKARQAKKAKDFAAAISLYQEAKKGFQGLLAEAKKIPDRATGAYNKAYAKGPTVSKTSLINWCIRKMGECDNAIEAIRNGQMKGERKAAAKEARAARKAAKRGEAVESYLDSITEYEAVIESLGDENVDPDFDEDPFDDFDDEFEDTEDTSLESLMI